MKQILNALFVLVFVFNNVFSVPSAPTAAATQAPVPTSTAIPAGGFSAYPPPATPTVVPTTTSTVPARMSTPQPTASPTPKPTTTPTTPKPSPTPRPEPNLPARLAQKVPKEGGSVTGLDGRLKMTFPADSLSEAADVWVVPVDEEQMPPTTLSGNPFQIVSKGQNSQQSIRKFSKKATIEMSYDPKAWGGKANFLVMYYYDEDSQSWVPLPSRVDTQRHVLIATTDHLTIFDANATDWEGTHLPGVKGWQVSNFTGAATYSYPLQMPDGPGGLKPSLTLNYDSQVVDSATLETQAGWVGMGWSLETGYIQRNMNGTPDDVNDDTFSLVIGGMEHMLLPDSSGYYHTADETFWRLQMNGANRASDSTWTAWDKTGTVYKFEDQAKYLIFDNCHDHFGQNENYLGTTCDEWHPVWRWSMTKVKNVFGQELTYTYSHETKQLSFAGMTCDNQGGGLCIFTVDVAVTPNTIVYPNGRYRVKFETATRADYSSDWAPNNAKRVFFSRSKLTAVRVEQDGNGDGVFETLTRKWVFSYAGSNDAHIFNGYTWTAGEKTLTLLKVEEYGLNGAGPLPATTFTYDADNLHLQEANNGQGGKVTFSYERLQMDGTQAPPSSTVFEIIGRSGDTCGYLSPNAWTLAAGGASQCMNIGGTYPRLDIFHDPINGTSTEASKKIPLSLVRPGGTYHLIGRFVYAGRGERIGFRDNNGATQLSSVMPSPPPADSTIDMIVNLAATSSGDNVKALVVCPDCSLGAYTIQLTMTRYRVTQKVLNDGLGNPAQTYSYTYSGAATNDAAHSAIIAANLTCTDTDLDNDLCYSAAYSEFRGHSAVTETGPDGRATTTWFHQDDERVGQVQATQIAQGTFYDNFNSLNPSNWTTILNGGTQTIEPVMGDPALKTYSPNSSQTVWAKRPANTSGQGKASQFQFWVDGANTQAFFMIESDQSGSDYNRWGFKLGADGRLVTNIYQAGVLQPEVELTASNVFKTGRWYVAWLIVSDSQLFLRIKERDDPTIAASYELPTPAAMKNHNWHFSGAGLNGTLRMDEYREGNLYRLSETVYTSVANLVTTVYPQKNSSNYVMSPIHWVSVTWQKTFTFEGGAESVVQMVQNYYDVSRQGGTQYGNLTRTEELSYNGSIFVPYRGSESLFYPFKNNNVYLVGLPGEVKQFSCPSTGCVPSDNTALLANAQYLYDTNTVSNASPSVGKLSAERHLLRWAGASSTDPRYADADYGYDAWGNRVSVTQYSLEGSASTLARNMANNGARRSVTCYGAAIPGETCADDGYHTYPLWQKNALNQVTNFGYNYALGQPTQLTDPNLATTAADYDIYGRIVKIARPGDDLATSPTLQFAYQDSAIPFWTAATQKIDASHSLTVRKFYNGLGELVQTQQVGAVLEDNACSTDTDTNSDTCTVVVDQKMEYVNGEKKAFQAAAYAVTASSGYITPPTTWVNVTETTYDTLGRVVKTLHPDGTFEQAQYSMTTINLLGTSRTLLDTITLDAIQSGAMTPKKAHTYSDAFGRVIAAFPVTMDAALVDQKGPYTLYEYDSADRLKTVKQIGPKQIEPYYIISATTTLDYDVAGRKTSMTDPDMGRWTYAYDAYGNLISQTDAKGQTTCLFYDALNRLKGKIYAACPPSDPNSYTITYTYDSTAGGNYGIGRRTGMTDLSGSTAWIYDARGHVLQESRTVKDGTVVIGTYNTSWTYNSAERVTTMTYPTEEMVTFSTLPQGMVSSLSSTYNLSYLTGATADYAGRLKVLALGNGTKTVYSYYDWATQGGRLKSIFSGLPESIPTDANPTLVPSLQGFQYSYDAVGNITQIVQQLNLGTVETVNYTYDSLNRLDLVTGAYADDPLYDPSNGNLTKKGEQSIGYGTQLATCPNGALTKVHAATSHGTADTYCYDQNGNMVKRKIGTKVYTLAYDPENRLTAINGELSVAYVYDGDGNRVLVKQTGGPNIGDKTIYIGNYFEVFIDASYTSPAVTAANCGTGRHCVYFPLAINSLINPPATSGQIWKSYYYAGSARIAMRVQDSAGQNSNGIIWLYTDHLGSTTVTANNIGRDQTVTELRYTAWGESRGGTALTSFRYTGQRESEADLYFYQARFYDSSLGRFVTGDSIIPDPGSSIGWDRYAYTSNNPVNRTDPSGHMQIEDRDTREGDPDLIKDLVMKKLDDLLSSVENGNFSDLEAFARLSDYAESFSPTCPTCFVKNLGAVLTGDTGNVAWINEVMGQLNSSNWDSHFNPSRQLGQSGFAPIFQDPGVGGAQPHHFWFYVQMGYQQSQLKNNPSVVFPFLAVIAHETIATKNTAGNSFEDVALGYEGVNLGANLWIGSINPSDVGNYIRRTLSPGSINAIFWEGALSNINQLGTNYGQASQFYFRYGTH